MRLTDEGLDQIFHYWRLATPQPVAVFQIPVEADPVEWVRDSLSKNIHEEVYGVAYGTPEEIEHGEHLITALTGNGPTSLDNANFYMMCHTAIPALIDEIHRLRVLAGEGRSHGA